MNKHDFSPEAWKALNDVVDVALATKNTIYIQTLTEALPILEKELGISLIFEDKSSVLDKLVQTLDEANEQRIKITNSFSGSSLFSGINSIVSLMTQFAKVYDVNLKFTKINNGWLSSDYDFELDGKISEVRRYLQKMAEIDDIFKPILLELEAKVEKFNDNTSRIS